MDKKRYLLQKLTIIVKDEVVRAQKVEWYWRRSKNENDEEWRYLQKFAVPLTYSECEKIIKNEVGYAGHRMIFVGEWYLEESFHIVKYE